MASGGGREGEEGGSEGLTRRDLLPPGGGREGEEGGSEGLTRRNLSPPGGADETGPLASWRGQRRRGGWK